MDKWVFLNGEFTPCENAHVSIYDHGFLYGDGAFEGLLDLDRDTLARELQIGQSALDLRRF